MSAEVCSKGRTNIYLQARGRVAAKACRRDIESRTGLGLDVIHLVQALLNGPAQRPAALRGEAGSGLAAVHSAVIFILSHGILIAEFVVDVDRNWRLGARKMSHGAVGRVLRSIIIVDQGVAEDPEEHVLLIVVGLGASSLTHMKKVFEGKRVHV